MPRIYLSPSAQQANQYVTGGSEEYYMNLVADAMEPYLRASGIAFTRNRPDMTAGQIIRASNAGDYEFHLALHSNAAPEGKYGEKRGVEIYYFPYSANGKRAAQMMADNFKAIYPDPDSVFLRPTTSLGEVDRTRAPSVLAEIAYHDNEDDANWIINNIQTIARALSLSLTEYFGIPFVEPQAQYRAQVVTESGGLNIRRRPNTGAEILASAPRGATVTVYSQAPQGWAVVGYQGMIGYAVEKYLKQL
ncbi:MAG: N-acetylmuramoyl-L-alanine amidase [Oscillospiraceae bacterium]